MLMAFVMSRTSCHERLSRARSSGVSPCVIAIVVIFEPVARSERCSRAALSTSAAEHAVVTKAWLSHGMIRELSTWQRCRCKAERFWL